MTIERVYDGKRTTHWRVPGKGAPVTVRCSDFGVYVCLTCLSSDCAHAKAVEAFDKEAA